MAGELTHVRHDYRLAALCSGAADAAAEFDLQTADRADVRSDHEAVAADAVEAGPEEVRKLVSEDRIDRRHQRDLVEGRAPFLTPDGDDGFVRVFVCSGLVQSLIRLFAVRYSLAAGRRFADSLIRRSFVWWAADRSEPANLANKRIRRSSLRATVHLFVLTCGAVPGKVLSHSVLPEFPPDVRVFEVEHGQPRGDV